MLKDLLLSSRSYRSFDESVKISPKLLADWVDCTRYAPSSINLQMLKFCAVTEPSLCADLLFGTRWAGKIKDTKLPPIGHAPVAYIIICADKNVISDTLCYSVAAYYGRMIDRAEATDKLKAVIKSLMNLYEAVSAN